MYKIKLFLGKKMNQLYLFFLFLKRLKKTLNKQAYLKQVS
jgi:hypothetical protein